MNRFMVFANRHRVAVRRAHPDWTMAQVGSELGRLYRLEYGLTKKSKSPKRKAKSPKRKSASPKRKAKSPKRKSASPKRKAKSPKRKSASPKRKAKNPKRKSVSPKRKAKSPKRKSVSPKRKAKSPKRGRGRSYARQYGGQMGWGQNPSDTARLRQVLLQRLYGDSS